MKLIYSVIEMYQYELNSRGSVFAALKSTAGFVLFPVREWMCNKFGHKYDEDGHCSRCGVERR